jgi:hypothetical protein
METIRLPLDYESGAHSRLGYPGYFWDYPSTFWYFYLRFLKNIKSSFWHTYSKPVSSNALFSSGLVATFTAFFDFFPFLVSFKQCRVVFCGLEYYAEHFKLSLSTSCKAHISLKANVKCFTMSSIVGVFRSGSIV